MMSVYKIGFIVALTTCFVFGSTEASKQKFVVHGNTISRNRQEVDAKPYSLNPSFKKPSYMRHITARKHIPATDVILPCMATGVKPITYSWRFNGKPLSKRKRLKFTDDSSILKIRRIRNSEVGIYTCIAKNAYGSLSFDFKIRIKEIQKEPMFYDLPTMQRKQMDIRPTKTSIKMECKAFSSAPVHYVWLKNGKPFKHIKPPATNVLLKKIKAVPQQTGDLSINYLKVNDGGLYTCIAFNKYGNASFTYELRILRRRMGGPPKVIPYTRPQIINTTVGQNVSMDCLEIISGTLPHVQWFHLSNPTDNSLLPTIPKNMNWLDINNPKNGFKSKYIPARKYESFKIKDLHPKTKNEYVYDNTDPYGLRLNLNRVRKEDTGVYVCYVSNSEGSDYTQFYLIVNDDVISNAR
ncbi:fibroblast growth factor receptor-like 1 [Clytia hemisphaerica]|uniref:Ig-like domain-containing protein n=1 Tax=Clytia hemisphaerica TaxID=252671 RepID=A0A7M5X190_9CNID|eukprot:TCONS_00023518-protein